MTQNAFAPEMGESHPIDNPGSIAIVHDYLTQKGGAERVVLAMHRAFPTAPIYTSLYEPDLTFPEFRDIDIRPSYLNHSRLLRRQHRLSFPLSAPCLLDDQARREGRALQLKRMGARRPCERSKAGLLPQSGSMALQER